MTKNNIEFEFEKPDKSLVKNKWLYIVNNPRMQNIYSVYLNGQVCASHYYREFFNLLRNAEQSDNFIIYLNNSGGYVHTGIEIINSMKACHGTIYIVISGPIYSMAPIIALHGDKIYVEDDTHMMFHSYSGGMMGKQHEMEADLKGHKALYNQQFKSTVKGFLTAKEVNDILNGKDLYIRRNSILKRLKKMGKIHDQQK